MKWSAQDYGYMARAMQLARSGIYTTQPNPRVGCVIVNEDGIVGEGAHIRAGEHHAEIHALKQAGRKTRGADCYITLEPCVHTGRTPPCTEALVSAGISKVVVAMVDPNPRVSGKGLSTLAQQGIDTASGLLEDQARELNAGFIKRMLSGMPYIRCKLAASIDGKTALTSGVSKWISGEAARKDVQYLRARSCAVLTGSGTVLADDPLLTVRGVDTLGRQAVRVILDRRLRTPEDARIFRQPGRVIIFTKNTDISQHALLKAKGAEVIVVDEGDFTRSCLRYLAVELEVNEVLVEAGATLSGSLLEAGLIDELVLYQAPVILGDKARGLFTLPELVEMKDRTGLELKDVRHIGTDLRFVYRFST